MSFFDLPPIIERMLLISDKISDLNFSVGQPPQVEINGKLTPVQPLGLQKLMPYQTEIIAMTLAVYLVIGLAVSALMNWYNARIALVTR